MSTKCVPGWAQCEPKSANLGLGQTWPEYSTNPGWRRPSRSLRRLNLDWLIWAELNEICTKLKQIWPNIHQLASTNVGAEFIQISSKRPCLDAKHTSICEGQAKFGRTSSKSHAIQPKVGLQPNQTPSWPTPTRIGRFPAKFGRTELPKSADIPRSNFGSHPVHPKKVGATRNTRSRNTRRELQQKRTSSCLLARLSPCHCLAAFPRRALLARALLCRRVWACMGASADMHRYAHAASLFQHAPFGLFNSQVGAWCRLRVSSQQRQQQRAPRSNARREKER